MMQVFPALDPIPLPAPVWFIKTLHLLVLSFHFVAVHLVIGGLLVATFWNFYGWRKRDDLLQEGSAVVSTPLPVVMTFLINLGVPPLLFTQLLYGRALYTSSILIGAYWLGVVFLLMALYYLLYVIYRRSQEGKAWWGWSMTALVIGAVVANIYNHNMTLMLRPEVWTDLWRSSPHGLSFPPRDPTVFPRWLFMMAGSLGVTGISLVLLGLYRSLERPLKGLLIRQGGQLASVGFALQLVAGFWVYQAQPGEVRSGLLHSPVYMVTALVWLAAAVAVIWQGRTAAVYGTQVPAKSGVWVAHIGVAAVAAAVVFRDGIRDASLKLHGFDIWASPVYVNTTVVAAFLVLFVIGVGLTAWMGKVVYRAFSGSREKSNEYA